MSKKFSWIMLATLFLALLIVHPLNRSEAPPLTKVSVDPPETKDPLLGVGSTFKVNITVSDVVELFSYQVNMTYNPSAVNTTAASIVEGSFLKQGGTTMLIKKTVNNTAGYLAISYMLFPIPQHGVNGSGTLFSVTFKVKSLERGTLLRLEPYPKTKLITVIADNSVPIEFETEDGVFDNRVGNEPPVASFAAEPSPANVSETVQFNATASYDPDAWLVSYRWNYGDGTFEVFMRERFRDINLTTQTTHSYNRAGVYNVVLTVTDSDNATATSMVGVTVIGHDIGIIAVENSHLAVMPGTPVTFNVTVANQGYPYSETFSVTVYSNETAIGTQDLTDFPAQTQTTLTFAWNTTGLSLGKYTIKANTTAIAEDYDPSNNEFTSGTVTISLTNIVDYPVIVGGFTFHVTVESTSFTSEFEFSQTEKRMSFNATGETGTGGFSNITIPVDLLGGAYVVYLDESPIAPEPQETTNGTHVFLYFSYAHGATGTCKVKIIGETVATPPIAIFTLSESRAIANAKVTFNATSSRDPDGDIMSYQWSFGDDNITTISTPIVTHHYTSVGNYTITLTITDDKQLTNSTEGIIEIIDYPRAVFTHAPLYPLIGEAVSFNASKSEPRGGTITAYKWDFGDGTTATGITYTHTYQELGNYIVVLNVTDNEELWDTETRTITVSIHNIAIKDLTATPNTAQIGQQISITARIENKGNFTENTDLSAYYDSTLIETKTITNMAPADSRTITITWNTSTTDPDTYELKVVASAVTGETDTDDNTLTTTVTVTKKTSQLILEELLETLTLGDETTISGTISPALPSISVTIQHKLIDAQSWTTIGVATTDSGGHYTLTWKPEATGTYEVKAAWLGDPSTLPSESDPQQITVEEPPAQINAFYLAGAVIIIILVAVAVYFLKIRKK